MFRQVGRAPPAGIAFRQRDRRFSNGMTKRLRKASRSCLDADVPEFKAGIVIGRIISKRQKSGERMAALISGRGTLCHQHSGTGHWTNEVPAWLHGVEKFPALKLGKYWMTKRLRNAYDQISKCCRKRKK